MEENGEPLRVADPRFLGGFEVRGRLVEHVAGTIYAGRARDGDPVALAVLSPAAAADAAVRDRFAAAVGARSEGERLEAAPRGQLPWAAVSRQEDAAALLNAAGLTVEGAEPASGPGFAPHWTSSPEKFAGKSGPFSPAPPGRLLNDYQATRLRKSAMGTGVVIVGALAVGTIGILVAYVVFAVHTARMPSLDVPTSPPSAQPTTGAPATPTPGSAPRGGTGPVAGPRYDVGERVFHMDLKGLPFDFDAPSTWGCMKGKEETFDSVHLCVDDGGTFPPSGSGAGGLVGVQKCPAPCGERERKALRKRFSVDETDWRRIDATTMYARVEGVLKDDEKCGRQVRVAMSRVFASKPGGKPDTAVAVQLTGPPAQQEAMHKLINEIHFRTP